MRRNSIRARRLGVVLAAGVALLAIAGTASAATPTAITGPVSAVGTTSATASGTVNPNGQATSWVIEYGTSTSYGSKTAAKSAGSGTTNVDVSASLGSLAPATTYHYRVVATNGSGTSRGADGIFTTTAAPAAVTGDATGLSTSAATLNGSVDPNGRGTTWYFEYGTSTSYGSKTADKSAGSGTSPVGVSAGVSGLGVGRTYHYRLVATSDAGTSRGADRNFATTGAPTAVTAPASGIAPTSAKLNGSVTPNGQATTWWFDYGTTTAYGTQSSIRSAGSGTKPVSVSSIRSRLKGSTTYHFRIVAKNASGTSYGADQAFTTSRPPSVRTGPTQAIGASTATLTGAVDPNGRTTSWWFEYGTTTAYGSRTASKSATGAGDRGVSAPLSALGAGAAYHYRLVAKSDAGTSYGADGSFATAGVTLNPSTLQLVYGRGLRLAGTVPTRQAGQQVTLYAQAAGEPSSRLIATLLTGTGGVWSFRATPGITTTYKASWGSGMSPSTTVGVRPRVVLRTLVGHRFSTRVVAPRSFAFRFVQLQRRTAVGRWVTVKRVRLNRRSAAVFTARLPKGASRLRVAMSVNQAGAGYLAGISRTLTVRR